MSEGGINLGGREGWEGEFRGGWEGEFREGVITGSPVLCIKC